MNKEWLVVIGSIIAAFSAILGINAMSSASELLASSLSEPIYRMSSVTSFYLVAQIGIIPVTILFLKYVSPAKLTFYASISFATFSLLCAFSNTLEGLLIARVGQGLSSGILVSAPMIVFRSYLSAEDQPKALTLYALFGGLAPICGPMLTGFLTATSVHYLFLMCAALPPIACLLTFNAPEPRIKKSASETSPLNLLSLLMFTTGLGLFIYTLEIGHDLFWFESTTVRVQIGCALFLISMSVAHQSTTKNPLVPFNLLINPRLMPVFLTSFAMGIAVYGFMYLVPFYLVQAHGASPKEVMYILMYSAIPQALLLPLFVKLRDNIPSRFLIVIGSILMTFAMYQLSFVNPFFFDDEFILPQLFRALGVPLCILSLSIIFLQKTKDDEVPGATTLISLSRALGGALSIAMATAFVQYRHSIYQQNQFGVAHGNQNDNALWHYAFGDMFSYLGLFFLLLTVVLILQAAHGHFQSRALASP